MKITIEGELTDYNTYSDAERSHRYLAARIKKDETQRVAWHARAAARDPLSSYPVHITYHWYTKDGRKDLDNVAFAKKFINDGLVLAGVLPDDSRKYVAGFTDRFDVDKARPRVELLIVTLHH